MLQVLYACRDRIPCGLRKSRPMARNQVRTFACNFCLQPTTTLSAGQDTAKASDSFEPTRHPPYAGAMRLALGAGLPAGGAG